MTKTHYLYISGFIASETIICVDKPIRVSFLFYICIYLLLLLSLPNYFSLTVKHMVMVTSVT